MNFFYIKITLVLISFLILFFFKNTLKDKFTKSKCFSCENESDKKHPSKCYSCESNNDNQFYKNLSPQRER